MSAQVYRHFDAAGNLLYIGATQNVLQRTLQHKHISSWFGKVATISVEHFPSKKDALRAEAIAINEEKPKYNISAYGKYAVYRPEHLFDYAAYGDPPLSRLSMRFGSIDNLSKKIKVHPTTVRSWMKVGDAWRKAGYPPFHCSHRLVEAANGDITLDELRPDVFFRKEPNDTGP